MAKRNTNHNHKPTILVVDDSTNVATTLAMVLEQSGYNTVMAHSGEQGVDVAVRMGIDLALIDVNLPGADGVKAAVELCKRLPSCKILLMSGDSGTTDILERAQAEGINFPILAKPIPPDQLLGTVQALLAGKAARAVSDER